MILPDTPERPLDLSWGDLGELKWYSYDQKNTCNNRGATMCRHDACHIVYVVSIDPYNNTVRFIECLSHCKDGGMETEGK